MSAQEAEQKYCDTKAAFDAGKVGRNEVDKAARELILAKARVEDGKP